MLLHTAEPITVMKTAAFSSLFYFIAEFLGLEEPEDFYYAISFNMTFYFGNLSSTKKLQNFGHFNSVFYFFYKN